MTPETAEVPEKQYTDEELLVLRLADLVKRANSNAKDIAVLQSLLNEARAGLEASTDSKDREAWKTTWERISELFIRAHGHGIDDHDSPGPGASGIA